MDFYVLALRVLHVGGGVIWAGTAITVALFVSPAVRALGPDGGKFMQQMVGGTKYLKIIPAAAIATIASGVLLYMRLAGAPGWAASLQGIVLGLGAVAGFAGWVAGFAIAGPTSARMAQLGEAIKAAGGPPSPEQGAELQRLRDRMSFAGDLIAGLLAVSVVLMAVARYVY